MKSGYKVVYSFEDGTHLMVNCKKEKIYVLSRIEKEDLNAQNSLDIVSLVIPENNLSEQQLNTVDYRKIRAYFNITEVPSSNLKGEWQELMEEAKERYENYSQSYGGSHKNIKHSTICSVSCLVM